jgi:hypothetical protein
MTQTTKSSRSFEYRVTPSHDGRYVAQFTNKPPCTVWWTLGIYATAQEAVAAMNEAILADNFNGEPIDLSQFEEAAHA